jgi:outer membrane biogenesis lipoprotein LolB
MNRAPSWPALLFLAAALLSGCAHQGRHRTSDHALFLEESRRSFEESRAPYQTTGRMQLAGPGYRHLFDFSLRWESPARSRLDLTGPLGLTLASAAVGDTLAWLSVPMAGIFLKGSTSAMDSESTKWLGFPADAFFMYLEGWPQLAADVAPRAKADKGLVEYRYDFNDTSFSLWLDRCDGMPRKLSASVSGRVFLEAAFAEHRPFGAGLRPHRLTLAAPAREVSLEVEFDELRKAKSFPPGTWLPPEAPKSE